jgi:hypothetical protein
MKTFFSAFSNTTPKQPISSRTTPASLSDFISRRSDRLDASL